MPDSCGKVNGSRRFRWVERTPYDRRISMERSIHGGIFRNAFWIYARKVRLCGEDFHGGRPEVIDIGEEGFGVGGGHEPAAPIDLGFELAGGPAGVADEESGGQGRVGAGNEKLYFVAV